MPFPLFPGDVKLPGAGPSPTPLVQDGAPPRPAPYITFFTKHAFSAMAIPSILQSIS